MSLRGANYRPNRPRAHGPNPLTKGPLVSRPVPRRKQPRRVRTPLRLETLEDRLAPAVAHVAVIGDYGMASNQERDVSNLVHSWNPDSILTVGDNNYYTGSAATIDANIGQYYHDYIGNYTGSYGAGSPTNRFFPVLGNHDWATRTGSPALPTPYLNYFTLPGNERYYTFTQGPIQFFALDSGDKSGTITDGFDPDGYTSTSVQAQWLQAQLAASTAPWKIVYSHHYPYGSGHDGNDTYMQWPFKEWGASAVLTGHAHIYERLSVGGLPYFIDGLGGESIDTFSSTIQPGSQVRYNGDYGAMRIDATDTQIQFQFVTRTGQVIDTYTLQTSSTLPTVTVSATDATAAEPGSDTGIITVTRTGSTAAALTVNLSAGGSAGNGVDFATIANTVTIPAGSATATIRVTPIDDTLAEGSETVTLSVAASAGYNIGSANVATVTILDNDSTNGTLVPAGSAWKYLDNGSDQGTAWRTPTFNDSTWKTGSAELGYGDGNEATVVGYGPIASLKYITTYFRKAFTVNNPAAITSLMLRLVRDDGAVVYLNGVEVYRNNMGTGAVAYNTLAPLSLGGSDETSWLQAALSPANLVAGTNVLAVEIHQASPDSSDISFNLELLASINSVSVAAPSPPDLIDASDSGLDEDDNITSVTAPTFTGTATAGTTVKLYSDGVLVGSAVATDGVYTITSSAVPNGTHSITATATDSAGNSSVPSGGLSVVVDTVRPTADVTDVSPDPRSTSVSSISINFGERVANLDLADLKLSLNGGANLLTASQTLVTADNVTWTIGNLAGITGAVGTYALTLTAANSGITDVAGNALTGDASDTWQVSTSQPSAPLIIDNGAPGTATVGTWSFVSGSGFRSDYLTATAGTGSKYATWTFSNLTPGLYRVSATWLPAGTRASNAPFTVLQGSAVLGTVAVNQQVAPGDFTESGVGWKDLGGPYQVSGGSLTIRLTNQANGVVVADGIRIERLSPELAGDGARQAADPTLLTEADLDAIVVAAVDRWATALGPLLKRPNVTVADLPAGYLGAEGTSGILIDRDADGRGWFVDPTPGDDREFLPAASAGTLPAGPDSPAAGRFDLLTVVLHEFGHALGLPDGDAVGVMAESLSPGERRLIDNDAAGLSVLRPFVAARLDRPSVDATRSQGSPATRREPAVARTSSRSDSILMQPDEAATGFGVLEVVGTDTDAFNLYGGRPRRRRA